MLVTAQAASKEHASSGSADVATVHAVDRAIRCNRNAVEHCVRLPAADELDSFGIDSRHIVSLRGMSAGSCAGVQNVPLSFHSEVCPLVVVGSLPCVPGAHPPARLHTMWLLPCWMVLLRLTGIRQTARERFSFCLFGCVEDSSVFFFCFASAPPSSCDGASSVASSN